jgi:hypothetical protein
MSISQSQNHPTFTRRHTDPLQKSKPGRPFLSPSQTSSRAIMTYRRRHRGGCLRVRVIGGWFVGRPNNPSRKELVITSMSKDAHSPHSEARGSPEDGDNEATSIRCTMAGSRDVTQSFGGEGRRGRVESGSEKRRKKTRDGAAYEVVHNSSARAS